MALIIICDVTKVKTFISLVFQDLEITGVRPERINLVGSGHLSIETRSNFSIFRVDSVHVSTGVPCELTQAM